MDNINEIVAALAKARAKFPVIEKTETATIRGKTKAGQAYEYSYDYAPLAEILDKTATALSESEIVLVETIDETESGTELTVLLAHSSGQFLASRKLLGTFNDPKLFGGAMTYYRRYLIEGLLNIASQQDKDAQGVESETAPKKQPRKQPAKPAQAPKNKDPWAKVSAPHILEFIGDVLPLCNGYYTGPEHLSNTIGGWHNPGDTDAYESKKSIAVDHAAAKQGEK